MGAWFQHIGPVGLTRFHMLRVWGKVPETCGQPHRTKSKFRISPRPL